MTTKKFALLLAILASPSFLISCAQNASWHAQQIAEAKENKLTVGVVQRNISRGMSGGEVASVLGSPNIVSTDENGREVWIYDKFSTEQVVSGSNGITVNFSNVASGAASTSQSTITVIIKFDNNHKVRDFAYHKSSF